MFRNRVSNKSGKENNFLFFAFAIPPTEEGLLDSFERQLRVPLHKSGERQKEGIEFNVSLACHSPPPRVAWARPEKEDGRGEICTSETYFFGTVSRQRVGSLLRIFLPLVVPRRYSGRSVAIWPQCYPSPLPPPPPPPPRSAFPISFRNGGGIEGGRGGRMPPHWGRPLRLFGHTRERMRDDRNVIRRFFCT